MEPSTRAVSERSVRASWGALKVRSSVPTLVLWDAEQEKNLKRQSNLGVLTSSAAGARRSWARCGAYLTTGSSPHPWDSWKQACVNAVSTCGHQKILGRILWCGVSWRHTGRVTCRRECSPQNHTKCCDVLCNNIMTRSRRDRHVCKLNNKKIYDELMMTQSRSDTTHDAVDARVWRVHTHDRFERAQRHITTSITCIIKNLWRSHTHVSAPHTKTF